MTDPEIIHQPHWRTNDVAAEVERDGYMVTRRTITRGQFMQDWQTPAPTNVAMAYIRAFEELKKAGVPQPAEVWVDRKMMERLDFDLRKISLTWAPDSSPTAQLRIGDTEFRVKG